MAVGGLCATFCANAADVASTQAPKKKGGTPVTITADGENRFEAGIAYASGNVVARYGEDVVYADKIAFNNQTKEITAYGNVRVYSKGDIYRCDQVTYNFPEQKIISSHFLTAQERYLASGEQFLTPEPKHYTIRSGMFTTDDREHPSYRVESNTIEIYPDDRVVLKNSVFYVGDVPVFWIPYSVYSLNRNKNTFDIMAGSSSRWGAYVRTSYNIQWNQKWSTSFNIDYRDKRGPSGGVDFDYIANKNAHALFRSFWIHDNGNDIGVGSVDRPLEPKARRFRFEYKHSSELAPDLFSTADINVWSDRHVTQDFFPDEFDQERIPDNHLSGTYYNQNFTFTVLGRSQANNLFEVVERKPEVILEFKRQKIPYTFLSYEGESSVVNFERVFDRDDTTGRTPYRAVRYDTYHQILYPRQYFDWLSLTPRAGIRGSVYTRNNEPTDADPNGDISRYVANAGLEASFKVSKTWLDVKNEKYGIDGLRHAAEPFMNFTYVPPSNQDPGQFRGFDDRIANTRLAPLNFPAYNSIDSIGKMTVARHGVRNKLQTKRDGVNVDLFDWVIYGDLDITREGWGVYTDTAGVERMYNPNRIYPELYNDVTFNPLPWLKLEIQSAAGLTRSSFDEVNSNLTWQVHPAIELSVGNRYLDGVPFVNDSNLMTCGSFYRLNENWQVAQSLAFEADDGTLQEHRYSVYRDLSAWNFSTTAAFRDNRDVPNEFLLYFSFTLKAFPEQSISVNY